MPSAVRWRNCDGQWYCDLHEGVQLRVSRAAPPGETGPDVFQGAVVLCVTAEDTYLSTTYAPTLEGAMRQVCDSVEDFAELLGVRAHLARSAVDEVRSNTEGEE